MPVPHIPKQNHLLARLRADDFARIELHLQLVQMPLGEALHESGGA